MITRTQKVRPTLGATRSGMTLIETAISITLLVTVFGSTAVLLDTTSGAYQTTTVATTMDSVAGTALRGISGALQGASGDIVILVTPSMIEFQRGVGYLNGSVDWGDVEQIGFEYGPGEVNDGIDNDGDGLVDEGRIVHILRPGAADEERNILCTGVREWLEGEAPGNLVDDNGNGLTDEAGLAFDLTGDGVSVWLTVERMDSNGALIVRTVERFVAFRNYGS